ncbi:hypothetical protein HY345_04575 [Candidatus Microgenomates bacterium]|nr:hypothetical protein [Candidatus Microgenomates bacterium]
MPLSSKKKGTLVDTEQAAEYLTNEAGGDLVLVQKAVDNTAIKIMEVRPELRSRGVYGRSRKEAL